MRRWAYEIHSTFILKDAPLAIKFSDDIVEAIENTLNVCMKCYDIKKELMLGFLQVFPMLLVTHDLASLI